jgi:hypothetical protein
MAREADAFIAMPGGFGTLEELLEVITWQQLGFHSKPIGLLNTEGFYDSLLTFFDHCIAEVGARPAVRCPTLAPHAQGARVHARPPATLRRRRARPMRAGVHQRPPQQHRGGPHARGAGGGLAGLAAPQQQRPRRRQAQGEAMLAGPAAHPACSAVGDEGGTHPRRRDLADASTDARARL